MSASGVLCSALILAYALCFDPGSAAVGLTTLGAMVTGYVLIRRAHPRLGKAIAITGIYACLTVLSVRHGFDSGVHFGFGVVALVVLACLGSPRVRWVVFAVVVATAALSIAGLLDGLLAETNVDAPHETTFFTLLMMAASYWISEDLLRVNREFRLRSRAVVDEIGARSAELSGDLQRLGRQSEDLRVANAALAAEAARGERIQRELRVAREQLEQFVYAASHDLKEPLRSISGFVQLIRRKVAAHDDADLGEYTDIVLASSAGMTRLLDGLLRYSRAAAAETAAEDVDLYRLAVRVRHDLSAYAAERGGTVEIAEGLGTTACAKTALREILKEVVQNALQFSRPGEAPRVEIGPCPVGGDACLAVRDYGIGIEPAFHERIFLLFQRLNRVDEYDGAGIGLALARRLATANGITISAKTPPEGSGVIFLIACPEAAPTQAPCV